MSGVFVIEGRGGKGGGHTPKEDRDSLRSTQIADVVDLISEGECEGLVDGLKSVYLDGVPIENPDGSRNFSSVEFAWTAGTQGQAALPGTGGVQSERPVGVQVEHATPIVRTITNGNIDTVRVTIMVPQLSRQDMDDGDLHGSSFEWAIDVQSNGGGFVQKYSRVVDGKTMSAYTKSVLVPLKGGAPYDIRVRRITADSTSSATVNAFHWLSYTEIQSLKLRYPNSALAKLRIDAQQFSRIPVRSFRWKGVRMQVPTNYNPVTRAYTGTWDGTFKIAWTNNPAWVLNMLITHPRFGLGAFVDPAFCNKWALYKIGQYCDGLVSDGRGGTEPRFTCNAVLSTREEAFKVLRDFSAIFRGLVYWGNAAIEFSQDAPQEPELLYTPANVLDGDFNYEDASDKAMHSVFIAYWTDLSQQGKNVPEVYAPNDLIARYGVRELSLQLIGCTSRGQAARMCRWAAYSEQHEGTLVSFTVGSDGQVAAPGKVFKIADPGEAGERLGGRIKSATTGSLVLDAPLTLNPGETYSVTVVQPVAGQQLGTVTETRTITTPSGVTTDTLAVSPSFSVVPTAGHIWVVQSGAIAATTWRCLGVKEIVGKNQFAISAIAHNPSKFAAIEEGLALAELPVSRLKAVVAPPTSLSLVETVFTDGTTNKSRVTASWVPSAPNLSHDVMWRRDNDWWQRLPTTTAQSVDIGPLEPGVYHVQVTSTNALGNVSLAAQASITVAGGPSGVRALRLKASALSFKVPHSGSVTPASIDLVADVGGLSGSVTWTVTAGTATLSGTGTTRSLAYADMASETVTISASVVDHGQTFTDLITLFKVRDGAPGTPGDPGTPGSPGAPGDDGAPGESAYSAQLSLDVIALPADGSGAVTSYTGAFTSLVIFLGGTLQTVGWTFSRVNGDGVDSTLVGDLLTITSVSGAVDASHVDITATKAGAPTLTKRVRIVKTKTGPQGAPGTNGTDGTNGTNGTNGVDGARGNVQIGAAVELTSWSDSAANAALVAAGYSGPANRDVVTLYNSTTKWSEARVYVSGSWLTLAAYISGNMLVDGAVLARHLDVEDLSAVSALIGGIKLTGDSIESDDFTEGGTTGFKLGSDGSVKLMNVEARGDIEATSLKVDAANIVKTLNIEGDAIVVPRRGAFYRPESAGSTGGYTAFSLQPIIFPAAGRVTIFFRIDITARPVSGGAGGFILLASNGTTTYTLFDTGNVIVAGPGDYPAVEYHVAMSSIEHAPSAGTWTYSAYYRGSAGYGPATVAIEATLFAVKK